MLVAGVSMSFWCIGTTRLAWILRHLVNALEEFSALGIEFVSIREGVDTTTRESSSVLDDHSVAAFLLRTIESLVRRM